MSMSRILLLQIRDHPVAERQEQECFVAFSGWPRERFRCWNLVARPEISLAEVADDEIVVIGGAGAHSVTQNYPFTAPLAELVARCAAGRRPLFGSCWGHQFIARTMGGAVITDPATAEVGTFDLELTAAGRSDPWLAGLPPRFPVQLGHQDRVSELPPGAVELAYSARSRNQAFRLGELPVYGAQFHVELDEQRMIERATVYRDGYVPGAEGLVQLRARLRPSPEAATLFRRFLALAAGAA